MFQKLFEPITVKGMTLKNRLVVGPMEVIYCEKDGTITERYLKYVEEKAKGGWGLIINEAHAISEEARAFDCCSGVWKDEQIEGEKKVAEAAHKYGAKIAIQLIHGGRQTIATGAPVVGPSPIKDPTREQTPRELTVEEIHKIVEDFGDAALRVKKAGFDAVEIHGAHGYLIQEFTSHYSNKRTDEYGGSLRNRARFSLEIIANIRKKVGPNFPIIYRMSTTELLMNGEGLTIADSRALAKWYEEAGVDMIHCTVGNYTTIRYMLPPAAVPHGFQADYAEEIKKAVSIPVITVGRYNDPYIAEAALENGKADLICMARPSLADPHFPNKAKEGRCDEIIRCLGCQLGCITQLYKDEPIRCTVNPRTGKEYIYTNEPAPIKKNVVVVGGGVAGMEAAIAAAGRGHKVTIYEKSDRLGGQWLLAIVPPYKQEMATFIEWQKNQIKKLGIEVKLNTVFSADDVTGDVGAVILATGASPIVPKIKGVELPHVYLANDVLSGKKIAGERIAIIGGGEVGAETAAFLASSREKVAIFEMLPKIAAEGESSVNYFLFEYLNKFNVDMFTNSKVMEIKLDSISYEQNGEIKNYNGIDTVILALGSRPYNPFEEELKNKGVNVVTIGDAEKVRQGIDAIEKGYIVGYDI